VASISFLFFCAEKSGLCNSSDHSWSERDSSGNTQKQNRIELHFREDNDGAQRDNFEKGDWKRCEIVGVEGDLLYGEDVLL
jgi:hypothetical protein